MVEVSKYGIHYDSNLNSNWLLQKSGGSSAIGLPSTSCPFTTSTRICPHAIDVSLTKGISLPTIEDHPVFQYLLPIPNETQYKNILYVECASLWEEQAIMYLMALSSPSSESIFTSPNKSQQIFETVFASNISRVFVSGINPLNVENTISPLTLNLMHNPSGRLIMCGKKIPQYDYRFSIDFINLEPQFLENVLSIKDLSILRDKGSDVLREYMRGKVRG